MKSLAKALVVCALCLAALSPFAASADQDIGEVAVIEDSDGTIMAQPGASMPNVFLANVACKFYQTHSDQYEALFVFNTALTNIQQGWTVRHDVEGIGRIVYDSTGQFCANNHRLRITVNMGNVTTLPANPADLAPIVPFYPLTGEELMAHEFGHHWLAATNFDLNDGAGEQCLLRGYEPNGDGEAGACNGYSANDFNQHWSYHFNSCSLMYGSCIEDLGGGDFSYSYPLGVVKYSQLDQYLMGLRTPEEVDPMFVVVHRDGNNYDVAGTASLPMPHTSVLDKTGERVDVTIEDIIRQMGPRSPATSACHWKAAFILLHPAGSPPFPAQVEQVEAYRRAWESFYDWSTDNRGSFDTSLEGCGTGTETCIGKPEPGCGLNPDGDEPDGDEPDGDQPDGDEPDGDAPDGDLPDGDEPDGDQPDGDQPDGDKPDGDEPDGDIPADGDEPDGDEPDGDASADGDSFGCEPGTGQCVGDSWRQCNFLGTDWESIENCADSGLVCDTQAGCVEEGAGTGGCNATPSGGAWLLLMGLLAICARRRLA